jgi:Tfp pilus assembly protein PilF
MDFDQLIPVPMATHQEKLAIAWKMVQAGDLPGARQYLFGLTQGDPSFAHAWYLLGSVNQLLGNTTESLANYERVLRLEPDHVATLNNVAVALQALGMPREAAASLRIALRIKPDYAEAHSNLGNSLKEEGNLEAAVACYRRAIEIDPSYFDAYNNLGNGLRAQGHLAESVACYEKALELKPDNPEMHLNRALAWLHMGDFERGWREYEWRLKCRAYAIPPIAAPRWDGSPLAGQPILLYADHGFGDTIQFIRYAPMVRERGGHVIVACQKPIARLLASCPGVEQVVPEGSLLPEFTVHAPLMSLPLAFETRLSSVPARIPYLSADAALVSHWHAELGSLPSFKIGVAWQGNPTYRRDRERSFRLAELEPVAKTSGAQLISLQRIHGLEQLGEVQSRFAVTGIGEKLNDFMDTAAAMRSIDLIITPDTSLGHLAGALGVPIWLALSFAADARWLQTRSDSPWYPSMRLFRQERWGDWAPVFEQMAAELPRLMAARQSRAGDGAPAGV